MRDADKSKERLLHELKEMRVRVSELEFVKKQHKPTGEALGRIEEPFRKIFDHSNDGIFVVDPDRDEIVDVNFKASEMLGYTCEEFLSMPMSAIHPDEMPRLRAFAKSVSENGAGWTNELTCLTKSAGKLATEISASLIDISGRTCMIAMVRDITARKRAEAELRKANERMKADLEAAAQIQKSLLPSVSPVVEGGRFAWDVKPCEELAGDVLNIFRLDEHHLGFYILDVSGHGVPAAMLSITLHKVLSPIPSSTSLLTRLKCDEGGGFQIVSPAEVCKQLNGLFPMNPVTLQYFTLLYGILDLKTREFRFAPAGHCAPIYLPPGRKPFAIEEYGFPIGLFKEASYEEQGMITDLCGRLYLHSDGLTEAANRQGEAFGEDRLLRAIEESRSRPIEESLSHILERVQEWSSDTRLEDDLSLLALEMSE